MAVRRLARATPAPALEIAAILSIHLGAALATRLFDGWGEQGTAFARLALGAGVLLSSEPAIAVLVGVVLLGDVLGLRQIAALAAITVASVGSTLAERLA